MSDTWVDAGAEVALGDGDVVGLELCGREIALCRVGRDLYAVDNICTHGRARLSNGFLDGHEIECPLHQGRFDVRTGHPTCAPVVKGIRTYNVKVVTGRVFIAMGDCDQANA